MYMSVNYTRRLQFTTMEGNGKTIFSCCMPLWIFIMRTNRKLNNIKSRGIYIYFEFILTLFSRKLWKLYIPELFQVNKLLDFRGTSEVAVENVLERSGICQQNLGNIAPGK